MPSIVGGALISTVPGNTVLIRYRLACVLVWFESDQPRPEYAVLMLVYCVREQVLIDSACTQLEVSERN